MSAETRLRAILFQEGDVWVAQVLEYDIAAQAKTINETVRRLVQSISATEAWTCQKFGRPFDGIEAAPAKFFQMYEQADPMDFNLRQPVPEDHHNLVRDLTTRFVEDRAA